MVTRRIDPSLSSVKEARDLVRAELDEAGADTDATEIAVLLVSELATNAVQHTGLPFEVRVSTVPNIRVAVRDGDPRVPTVGDSPIVEGEHGRGLPLIRALSTRWGITAERDGKAIWFELVTPRAPAPPSPAAAARRRARDR